MMGPGNRVSLAAQSLRYFKGHTQLCPSSYLEVRCMADNETIILHLSDNHEDKSNMLRMVSWQASQLGSWGHWAVTKSALDFLLHKNKSPNKQFKASIYSGFLLLSALHHSKWCSQLREYCFSAMGWSLTSRLKSELTEITWSWEGWSKRRGLGDWGDQGSVVSSFIC